MGIREKSDEKGESAKKKKRRHSEAAEPMQVEQPLGAPCLAPSAKTHAQRVAAEAAARKKPSTNKKPAGLAALKRPAAAAAAEPPPPKAPPPAAKKRATAAKSAAKPKAAPAAPPAPPPVEDKEGGEEEVPREVDQEVEEVEEVEDPFTIVDVEGKAWQVRSGRRRSEKMSTLMVRSMVDGKPTSKYYQHLQFNDRVWADTTDAQREELSDKAIQDGIRFVRRPLDLQIITQIWRAHYRSW